MTTDWYERDEPHESPWPPEHPFGDPDAWRGDAPDTTDDLWRGAIHLAGWPEWNAGPEYQMWKRLAEEG